MINKTPFQLVHVRAGKAERSNRVFPRHYLFRVRHGCIDIVKTEGCIDDDKEGVTPIDISVPSGLRHYAVFVESTIEKNRARKNVLRHGPHPWLGFPNQPHLTDGIWYTLIAFIDTTGERPKVHPYVLGHVNLNLEWLAHCATRK